jgi:RimJ/RimL family protein N-acetyltransferase
LLLVIEVDGTRAGMLRLDRQPCQDDAPRDEIAIAVDSSYGNRGVGSAALALARRLMPAAVFDAEITSDNVASQRAFARAGFRRVGDNLYRSRPVMIEPVSGQSTPPLI